MMISMNCSRYRENFAVNLCWSSNSVISEMVVEKSHSLITGLRLWDLVVKHRSADGPLWNLLKKIRDLFAERGEGVRAETTFLMTDATTRDGDYIPKATPGEPLAYNGKAYTPKNQMTPGRTGYGDNNNIRVFRYADVLLMNAEAKVRKGENGDEPLNLVRTRAGMPPLTNATLDQILEERQVELALEWGERFFDLVRTDRAAQELPGFIKGEHEYYPIPQDQIDLNPNLKLDVE